MASLDCFMTCGHPTSNCLGLRGLVAAIMEKDKGFVEAMDFL